MFQKVVPVYFQSGLYCSTAEQVKFWKHENGKNNGNKIEKKTTEKSC